jgi:hypothetical protein
MFLVDVRDQRFELVLGAARGEVGDLRLEGAGKVGRGIDDLAAEAKNSVGRILEMGGESGGVGVEADAEQRVVPLPGGGERLR